MWPAMPCSLVCVCNGTSVNPQPYRELPGAALPAAPLPQPRAATQPRSSVPSPAPVPCVCTWVLFFTFWLLPELHFFEKTEH